MGILNEKFLKDNLIDVVFALRYSYGTDIHMGCTPETSPKFEEMMTLFMELSKKEFVSDDELRTFNAKKDETFSLIFHHRNTDDNSDFNKFVLKQQLAEIEFDEEFLNKKPDQFHLVCNVVEKFDDEE